MNFTLKKSDLNFKVYTVAAKPTTPGAENDIAIISSVPMTNWIMSPEKPSGIPRNDGDVWIQYSVTGNTFNALKNNAMMISTISAWQYTDGAWVDREAVSCQGGAWVDWIPKGWLYYKGNEIIHTTGGWKQTKWVSSTLGNVTKNSKSIVLDGSNNTNAFLVTEEKIDLTNYTTINLNALTCVANSSYGQVDFFVVDTNENPKDANKIFIHSMPAGAGVKTAQLEGVSGQYYVAISAGSWASGTIKLEFDHVWLE